MVSFLVYELGCVSLNMKFNGDLMYDEIFRYILVVVYFNYNFYRDVKKWNVDGVERVKLFYFKFKNGEVIVRDVRII